LGYFRHAVGPQNESGDNDGIESTRGARMPSSCIRNRSKGLALIAGFDPSKHLRSGT